MKFKYNYLSIFKSFMNNSIIELKILSFLIKSESYSTPTKK